MQHENLPDDGRNARQVFAVAELFRHHAVGKNQNQVNRAGDPDQGDEGTHRPPYLGARPDGPVLTPSSLVIFPFIFTRFFSAATGSPRTSS